MVTKINLTFNLMRKFFLIIFFIILVLTQRLFAQESASDPNIRVCILKNVFAFNLEISGSFSIEDCSTNKNVYSSERLTTKVLLKKDILSLAGKKTNMDCLLVRVNDGIFKINNRQYRGNFKIIKNKQLMVVNILPLEEYVKGIAIREISHYWPIEAIKANVIVFRTFALYHMQLYKDKDYDLKSDVYSQVYGGQAAERYRISDIVDQTRGNVLTYKDEILPSFFHSTCAGSTENAAEIWNIAISPLSGVKCSYCRESIHANWETVLSEDEIVSKLRRKGYKLSYIRRIKVIERNESGRISNLEIVTNKEKINIKAEVFRSIMGPDVIKSANFKVINISPSFVFDGKGWGHGVGLCQWGSYYMAKEDFTYDQILEYYYPGSKIEKKF